MGSTLGISKVVGTFQSGYTITHSVFARTSDDDSTRFNDATLFHQDSTGHVLWTQDFKRPDTSLILEPVSLSRAVDGDLLILCRITDGANTYDSQLIRTDSLGHLRWRTFIPANGLNYAYPVRAIAAKDNGVLVLNYLWRRSFVMGDSAYLIPVVRKFSADGLLLWQREYRKYQYDWPYDLLERSDGSLIIISAVTINTGSDSSNDDFHVIGTDAAGNQTWDICYGSPWKDRLNAGIIARDGNLVVTGFRSNPYRLKDSTINAKDLYIAKWQLPVSSVGSQSTSGLSVLTNYPNPFTAVTTIPYSLPVGSHVCITICDALGNTIKTLIDEREEPGIHSVQFNGHGLPAGAYFCQIKSCGEILTKSITKVE